MRINNIIIFLLGIFFGIFVFIIILWFARHILFEVFIPSWFGSSIHESKLVILHQDTNLYQGENKICILKKGAILEHIGHVDKIDHYKLEIHYEKSDFEGDNIFKAIENNENYSSIANLNL